MRTQKRSCALDARLPALGASLLALAAGCGEPAELEPRVAPTMVRPVEEEQDPQRLFERGADEAPRGPARHPELGFLPCSAGLAPGGTWRGYPLLHDLDGDGRADLVASNREEDGFVVWLAPRDGERGAWVRAHAGLPRDLGCGPAAAADVDRDGRVDLLVGAHTDGLRVYRNDGRPGWERVESVEGGPVLLHDLAAGDLDGDGDVDVVGLGRFRDGLCVFEGDGRGGFRRTPGAEALLGPRAYGRDVELADLDGDATPDLVAATSVGAKVFLTRPGAPLAWEEASSGLPAPRVAGALQAIAVGQFVAGGRPEILVCGVPAGSEPVARRKSIGVYAWEPAAHAWRAIDRGLAVDEAWLDARPGDFDGDGNLDLIALGVESGAVVHLGDGSGGFRARGRLPGITGGGRLALGDIDGDGALDVVVALPAHRDRPEFGGVRAFLNRAAIWR